MAFEFVFELEEALLALDVSAGLEEALLALDVPAGLEEAVELLP